MEKILLLMNNTRNRDLLKGWLQNRYSVASPAPDDSITSPFDLCILDGPVFDRFGDKLLKYKESNRPVFSPTLIITPRKDVNLLTRHLWKSVDELVITPIQKLEMLARVEILLRARRLSLEVKRYGEALQRDTKARLQLAISATNIGFWDWDVQTGKVYYSPELKHQIGYGENEISDNLSEWQGRIHHDDTEQLMKTVHSYIQNPWPDFKVEYRLRHKDGSYRWILTQALLTQDEQRNPSRILGCHIDITDRKKSEEELRRSEERLRLALKAAHQGLYDLDVRTGQAIVNVEYTQMLGYTPGELPAIDVEWWRNHVHNDDREDAMRTLEECISGKRGEYSLEYRLKTKSGNWRWILSLGKTVEQDKEGHPTRMLGTHTDITERKEIEEKLKRSMNQLAANNSELQSLNRELERANARLREADRIKTEFITTASHEISSPLTSILGFVQTLLASDISLPEESRINYLRIIETEARRLAGLAGNLLDTIRGETGGAEIAMERFPLPPLVDEITRSMTLPTNVRIAIEIGQGGDAPVSADREGIGQVIRSILDNAVRFSPPHTAINVRINRTDSGTTVVSIADSGPGISERELKRIFEKLHHVKDEISRSRGSGLGLAIAQHIIDAHQGRLWAESKPGEGSTFFFTIPAAAE